MDFKKYFRRRMKRVKASLRKPFEQSRALKKLWRVMGAQGVILHMARQGRWNIWLAFVLSLIFLGLVFGCAALAETVGFPDWTWIFIMPIIFISTFVHYALWRATSNLRQPVLKLVMRIYVIPMLALMFFLVLAVTAVALKDALNSLTDTLNASLIGDEY